MDYLFPKNTRNYARRDWPVVPVDSPDEKCCSLQEVKSTSRGKHPIPPQGLKEGMTDERRLENWMRHHPNASIGIRTGSQVSA